MASCSSSSALWIGYVPGGAMMQPKPSRKVSRSSRVIGRRAGTVSSSALSRLRSTRRSTSSGSSSSTAASSSKTPSSTRAIAAIAVIGLVSDAIRKMASRWHRRGVAECLRPDHLHVDSAPVGHQRDEPGHAAALDVARHDVVQVPKASLGESGVHKCDAFRRAHIDLLVETSPGWDLIGVAVAKPGTVSRATRRPCPPHGRTTVGCGCADRVRRGRPDLHDGDVRPRGARKGGSCSPSHWDVRCRAATAS